MFYVQLQFSNDLTEQRWCIFWEPMLYRLRYCLPILLIRFVPYTIN